MCDSLFKSCSGSRLKLCSSGKDLHWFWASLVGYSPWSHRVGHCLVTSQQQLDTHTPYIFKYICSEIETLFFLLHEKVLTHITVHSNAILVSILESIYISLDAIRTYLLNVTHRFILYFDDRFSLFCFLFFSGNPIIQRQFYTFYPKCPLSVTLESVSFHSLHIVGMYSHWFFCSILSFWRLIMIELYLFCWNFYSWNFVFPDLFLFNRWNDLLDFIKDKQILL